MSHIMSYHPVFAIQSNLFQSFYSVILLHLLSQSHITHLLTEGRHTQVFLVSISLSSYHVISVDTPHSQSDTGMLFPHNLPSFHHILQNQLLVSISETQTVCLFLSQTEVVTSLSQGGCAVSPPGSDGGRHKVVTRRLCSVSS